MKIYGKEIPGLEIGIFALVTLALAYFLGSRTGKAAAKGTDASQLDRDIQAGRLTYDLSQYKVLADRIFEALSGAGSDEEAIFTVFRKMRTNSDVLQLIKTFGTRGSWLTGRDTLAAWLSSDLSNEEIKKLNEILTINYITFQF